MPYFRLHFKAERYKFHSRADFFCITREPNETAEDVWTRILQSEKHSEFDKVTPAELIASKVLIFHWKIYGRLRTEEKDPEERHDNRDNNGPKSQIYV